MPKFRKKQLAAVTKKSPVRRKLDKTVRLEVARLPEMVMSDFSYGCFGGQNDAPWRHED